MIVLGATRNAVGTSTWSWRVFAAPVRGLRPGLVRHHAAPRSAGEPCACREKFGPRPIFKIYSLDQIRVDLFFLVYTYLVEWVKFENRPRPKFFSARARLPRWPWPLSWLRKWAGASHRHHLDLRAIAIDCPPPGPQCSDTSGSSVQTGNKTLSTCYRSTESVTLDPHAKLQCGCESIDVMVFLLIHPTPVQARPITMLHIYSLFFEREENLSLFFVWFIHHWSQWRRMSLPSDCVSPFLSVLNRLCQTIVQWH